jgi:hypothetical protein
MRRRARRSMLFSAVLMLSLAIPPAMLRPMAASAQAPGPQITIERPAEGSLVQGTVVVGGWAVDLTSPSGTGIVPDSVEVWLGPAGSGQWLGNAGYGDPRPDLAERFGQARFAPAGFRFFWNSCDAPPGPNVLTVSARSSGPGERTATAAIPITVGSCHLALGETARGRIATSGQADRWTFDGTAGERVAITLDAETGWDTLLELLAPDGTREDLDDDSGPDLNSWLSRRLAQTGTYTVVVRPFSTEGCTGDYLVLGWMGPPGSSDPNRGPLPADASATFTFRGSLREFDERQQWTFTGEAGQELILYTVRNVGSRLDPFIELLGPDGQLLARDDDSGGGLNAFLQGVLPQTGTYTLVTEAARVNCGGEYTLRVEPGWGEQSRLRGPLAFDEVVSGSLAATEARRDIWTFPATAGERVTLAVETNGPTRLQVAGPNGDWEQVRSTSGQPLGLSFVPAQSGTYDAVVFVDTSRPITYSLTLERGYGRLVANKGPVPLGQPVTGEIRFVDGRDLYTFEGRQGQQVRIALDRPGRSRLDPYLELLGPDGRTIAEDDDSGGELNSLIQLTLPQTGTYTIVARGLGDTAGPYVLTVTLSDGAAPAVTPTPGPTPPAPGPSPTPTRPPAAPPAPTPGPRR